MKGRYRVDLILYVAGRWVSVLYGYVALNLLTQNKASECELSRSRQPATLKSKKNIYLNSFRHFVQKFPVLSSWTQNSQTLVGTILASEPDLEPEFRLWKTGKIQSRNRNTDTSGLATSICPS